ncbi:hypothetical protein HOY82DRAFT_609519 [Tuber indicum]|nr:hypothetical protein HOY82DRAFT_609519 [Tuber indicum]
MSIPEAEKRLKLGFDLPGIPVKKLLEGKNVLLGQKVGGYPTEANPDFKEANINDIVVSTIYPLLALFKNEIMLNLRLSREKEITPIYSSTSGMEEFVVMDRISYDRKDRYSC